MKAKITCIGFVVILGILISVTLSTRLFPNIWDVMTGNGFIIPEESSIFIFKATKMNDGNGDYWIYGKDNKYYYSQMKGDADAPYIKLSKEKAESIGIFDETDFTTWGME